MRPTSASLLGTRRRLSRWKEADRARLRIAGGFNLYGRPLGISRPEHTPGWACWIRGAPSKKATEARR